MEFMNKFIVLEEKKTRAKGLKKSPINLEKLKDFFFEDESNFASALPPVTDRMAWPGARRIKKQNFLMFSVLTFLFLMNHTFGF